PPRGGSSSGGRLFPNGLSGDGQLDGGVWKQWEESTVQIKGRDGEVYAIRPSGERLPAQEEFPPVLVEAERAKEEDLDPFATLAEGLPFSATLPFSVEELPFSVEEPDQSEEGDLPQEVDDALRATLGATQQDLRSLRQQLVEAGLVDLAGSEDSEAAEGNLSARETEGQEVAPP
ncbi:unnamed protein product, partial [Polarella glacialis]